MPSYAIAELRRGRSIEREREIGGSESEVGGECEEGGGRDTFLGLDIYREGVGVGMRKCHRRPPTQMARSGWLVAGFGSEYSRTDRIEPGLIWARTQSGSAHKKKKKKIITNPLEPAVQIFHAPGAPDS